MFQHALQRRRQESSANCASRTYPALTAMLAGALFSFNQLLNAQDDAKSLSEVLVTATRLPRAIEDIAGTVSVITDTTIAQEIALNLDDLTRYQPGVTMNTAARGGNQGFTIRGIGGNRVLTVNDGIRSSDIYQAGPSSYGKDSFELDNLKSVQIIRGPASVLYGADAMGGAVVLTSKTPRDYVAGGDSYLGLRSAYGEDDDQSKFGLTVAVQLGELGILAQATRREFGEADVGGPGQLNPQDGESSNLMLAAFWDFAPGHQLRVSGEVFEDSIQTDLLTDLGRSVLDSIGQDETQRYRLGVDYRWEGESLFADDLQLIVNEQRTDALQFTRQQRTSFSFINPRNPATFSGVAAERQTWFDFNQGTTAVNLNLRKSFDLSGATHNLAYGFNYDDTETERPRDRVETAASGEQTRSIVAFPSADPEVFPNRTFPDSRTTRSGVYLQDEIVLSDGRLILVPGVRYDRYRLDPNLASLVNGVADIEDFGGFSISEVEEGQVSLSFGAIYDFNQTYSVFAQYAEGYRPPNFDEANQAFVNLGFGYASIPNPALQAESSKGYELGLRASFDRASFSIAAYDNRYEDFINSQFVGQQRAVSLFQDVNLGEARIHGIEFLGQLNLTDSWSTQASLAYSRGDDEEQNQPLDVLDPLTTVLSLGYDAPSGVWGVEAMLTAATDKDRVSAMNIATADGYAVVDVIGYWRFAESGQLRLGVYNLSDEEYARWANINGLTVDSPQVINANEPGTNFRVGLSYDF